MKDDDDFISNLMTFYSIFKKKIKVILKEMEVFDFHVIDRGTKQTNRRLLTPWLMEPGGLMPHLQGLSNKPYSEPNQPNYPHSYLSLQGPF